MGMYWELFSSFKRARPSTAAAAAQIKAKILSMVFIQYASFTMCQAQWCWFALVYHGTE